MLGERPSRVGAAHGGIDLASPGYRRNARVFDGVYHPRYYNLLPVGVDRDDRFRREHGVRRGELRTDRTVRPDVVSVLRPLRHTHPILLGGDAREDHAAARIRRGGVESRARDRIGPHGVRRGRRTLHRCRKILGGHREGGVLERRVVFAMRRGGGAVGANPHPGMDDEPERAMRRDAAQFHFVLGDMRRVDTAQIGLADEVRKRIVRY